MLFSDDFIFLMGNQFFKKYKKVINCTDTTEGTDRIFQWGIYTFLILQNLLINLVIIMKMMEWMKAISIIKREKDIDKKTLLSK